MACQRLIGSRYESRGKGGFFRKEGKKGQGQDFSLEKERIEKIPVVFLALLKREGTKRAGLTLYEAGERCVSYCHILAGSQKRGNLSADFSNQGKGKRGTACAPSAAKKSKGKRKEYKGCRSSAFSRGKKKGVGAAPFMLLAGQICSPIEEGRYSNTTWEGKKRKRLSHCMGVGKRAGARLPFYTLFCEGKKKKAE